MEETLSLYEKVEMTDTIEEVLLKLQRAQKYNEVLTSRVMAAIQTIQSRGVPSGPTMIACLEACIKKAAVEALRVKDG